MLHVKCFFPFLFYIFYFWARSNWLLSCCDVPANFYILSVMFALFFGIIMAKLIKKSCEDMISSHVKTSMISLTSSLSFKLYLNSFVYHWNIFGSSSKVFCNLWKPSEIFGNSRKMFGNVPLAFGTILENFRKSSELVGNLRKIIKKAVISTFIYR